MDVREKLVELLNSIIDGGFKWHSHLYESGEQLNNDEIASHLIDHGVTVQKHGRWLLDGRCSECLENPLTTHKTYCPSCGAKMDLER